MRKWPELLVAGGLTLGIAACNDVSVNPTGPSGGAAGPQASSAAPATLDDQIRQSIGSQFPVGISQAVTARWNRITDEVAAAGTGGGGASMDKARKHLVDLVGFVQSKTGTMTPPTPETQPHAAARLILLMSLYVYNGPDTPPPEVPAGSDAVVAIVEPSATATQTVQTPTQHAAVQFPPGSLGETRIIVIVQETTPFPVNCSGPLDTRLCQYPQFYEFNSFPDTRLLTPAIAAVCHINTGDSREPLADHDRFRIAHDVPADPANYVTGGTVVDGIEILPYVLVSGLTSCEGNSYDFTGVPIPSAPSGTLGSTLRWIAAPAQRLASAIFDKISPRAAWAIDGIGGGRFSIFSTFGVVDPVGAPDLAVTSDAQEFEGSFAPGDQVPIGSWSVANSGTATARNVAAAFVVARDSMLTDGTVLGETAGNAAALAPGQSFGGSEAAVTLPLGIEDGVYYVGVRAEPGEGGPPDPDAFNNRHAVRIVVVTGVPVIQ